MDVCFAFFSPLCPGSSAQETGCPNTELWPTWGKLGPEVPQLLLPPAVGVESVRGEGNCSRDGADMSYGHTIALTQCFCAALGLLIYVHEATRSYWKNLLITLIDSENKLSGDKSLEMRRIPAPKQGQQVVCSSARSCECCRGLCLRGLCGAQPKPVLLQFHSSPHRGSLKEFCELHPKLVLFEAPCLPWGHLPCGNSGGSRWWQRAGAQASLWVWGWPEQ